MRKVILTFMVAFACTVGAYAQKTVTGKVTDADGKGISNVSIVVKGTTTGTTTTSDGTYSITLPSNAKQLEFSYLSFETQTITVGNRNLVSIVMATTASKELAEVVITGINRVKKSEFTGASTKLDEKQIANKPVGSFDQILQGRVPGLKSLTGSGAPGTAATVIIRGQNSISGGSAPLYVIDGIQVEEGVFQSLNPNDFASLDILRDASAAALYGSRGSSGVIVITTKRGTSGKMKFSYSGQMGIKSRPEFAFRPMNTQELLKAQEDYGKIVGSSASTTILPGWYYSTSNPRYATLNPAQQAADKLVIDSISKINTNWSDEIFRQGNFSNHEITLSGGTGKTRLFSSLAFYNEEGTSLRSDMTRVTARNNLDYGDEKLNYSVNMNLGYTKRNFQQSEDFNTSNPFATSALAVPYQVLRKNDGTYATGTGTKYVGTNQLDQTFYDENYNNQFKGILSLIAGYKITNSFSAGVTTGVDFRETQATNYGSKLVYTRTISTSQTGKAGFQRESLDRFLTTSVRPNLSFRKVIREKHDIDVSVYGEYIKEIGKQFNYTGYGTDPKRPNTPAAILQGNSVNQLYANVGGRKAQTSLLSGLVTAKYIYNGKYTLSGSFRDDGSSKLPTDTRWQTFYSVGGIWELSKENFIKNISAINVLRIKASYGTAGNSNNFPAQDGTFYTGAYPYQPLYNGGTYSGLPTIIAPYTGNSELKWEVTHTTNIGIDFELLNRRLYGDINLYNKRTTDLFVGLPLSGTAGQLNGATIDKNAGELSNKGYEYNINFEVVRNQNFVWTVFATGSYNRNRVIDLGGLSSYEPPNSTEKVTVGLPLGSHYEVKWAGVDAATGSPLYYDKNGNITNVYNSDDAVQTFGTWEAPYQGGFGSSVRFKGFDLSVLFSWQQGGKKIDNLEYFLENPAGFLAPGYNQSSSLNFWKQPGDVVTTPSPLYSVNFSSKLIHDASFLRLRDITLSYTFPKTSISKMKFMSNAKLYVQGSNLFIWTHWRGRDPEGGATNINISEYPNPRAITAGLDITF